MYRRHDAAFIIEGTSRKIFYQEVYSITTFQKYLLIKNGYWKK